MVMIRRYYPIILFHKASNPDFQYPFEIFILLLLYIVVFFEGLNVKLFCIFRK